MAGLKRERNTFFNDGDDELQIFWGMVFYICGAA